MMELRTERRGSFMNLFIHVDEPRRKGCVSNLKRQTAHPYLIRTYWYFIYIARRDVLLLVHVYCPCFSSYLFFGKSCFRTVEWIQSPYLCQHLLISCPLKINSIWHHNLGQVGHPTHYSLFIQNFIPWNAMVKIIKHKEPPWERFFNMLEIQLVYRVWPYNWLIFFFFKFSISYILTFGVPNRISSTLENFSKIHC